METQEEVLSEDLFDFEEDESSKKSLNVDFLKETYDYETRFFIWDKSLAIQSPTWNMRDGQEIETYLDEFRRNPANATRDFGANPIDAVNPAIENKDFIDLAFERKKDTKHPILRPPRIQPNGDITDTVFRPEFYTNDSVKRYCHVDIGLTRDRLGLAIGHAYRWSEHKITDFKENVKIVKEPHIQFDVIASFQGYKDNPIQLLAIRKLIMDITTRGYKIHQVTLDGYQSTDFIQSMQRMGIASKVLSIDKTQEPFDELIKSIYSKQVHLYPLYIKTPDGKVNLPHKEMRQLERLPEEAKYDHPLGGSHDLLQAIAGVVYTIKQEATPTGGGYVGYLGINQDEF
jgi:hypothetical protein